MVKIIGERVKKIRIDKGLSQKELGDKLGVSRDVIANIEYSRVEPREWFIKIFCNEFNVNENWLINGNGEKYNLKFSDYDEKLSSLLINYLKNENNTALSIIEKLNNLSDNNLDLIERLVDELQKK